MKLRHVDSVCDANVHLTQQIPQFFLSTINTFEKIDPALKGLVPAREHLDPVSYAQASGVEDRDFKVVPSSIPAFLSGR
ncbi:MAG: hypothetical protein PHZ00_04060 [Candidatus Peribacteraceae bacterium]|nr:hypothetical protein [Candidatus Peribacteraceae bacterium]